MVILLQTPSDKSGGNTVPPPPAPISTTPKPNMGGLLLFGSGISAYAVAWTGGAPNATWTSLEDPTATSVKPGPRIQKQHLPMPLAKLGCFQVKRAKSLITVMTLTISVDPFKMH